LHTVDEKLWHRLIDVNLTGTFHGMRAAIPIMIAAGRGTIVNNASLSGLMPTRNEAAYSAAKAGVIALTRSGALEYGPKVRVNCVAPGHVRAAHRRLGPASRGVRRSPRCRSAGSAKRTRSPR
jgi:NAD(P)-dependent dehydrogenase (short-subunit alcohol dehydrogenase family)